MLFLLLQLYNIIQDSLCNQIKTKKNLEEKQSHRSVTDSDDQCLRRRRSSSASLPIL